MRAAFALVLLALALAGCGSESKPARLILRRPAPRPAQALAPGSVSPGNVSYGTIVAERAVAIPGGNGGLEAASGTAAGDVRASILAAIGAAGVDGGVGGGPTAGSETEFIIREDNGATISVVQGSDAQLRRGERVMIIHGPETRLAPLGKA